MADETTKDPAEGVVSEKDQEAAAKDAEKRQEEAEAAMTEAQKEELAAKRGETQGRDLSDHETAVTPEEVSEKGFYGTKVDPLPNSAYSVAGVTGGTAKASAKPKSQGGSGR